MATTKQKKAIANLVETGGNVYKAMVKAGYSPLTAKTPQKLTESKAWAELMDEYLNEERLAKKHSELLDQKRADYFVFPRSMEDKEIVEHVTAAGFEVITVRTTDKGKMAFYSVDDAVAIKAGLDMAYKLNGRYAPVKSANFNFNTSNEQREKAIQAIQAIRDVSGRGDTE